MAQKKDKNMILKAAIIGHFGFGKELVNGQTIKTKILADEMCARFGERHVMKIDTAGGKKALFKAPFQIFKALKSCKNIVILPAHNGLRVIAPLLMIQNHLFHRKLHYVVIGGWLPVFLKTRKRLAKTLKKYDGIYVETNTMKKALEEQGFFNVIVMPNCKNLSILKEHELVYQTAEPYPLCTFSRVMKEKGIEDAVDAVRSVNERSGRTVYTLDIYGQVDAGQTEWFDKLKQSFPSYVRYQGVVPFDKSVDTLKNCFALLFPTYYEGEGVAGTIIDAFAAGIPVIASNWKYNIEIITSEEGIIFPANDSVALAKVLEECACNPDKINALKKGCIAKSLLLSTEKVIGDFIKYMN